MVWVGDLISIEHGVTLMLSSRSEFHRRDDESKGYGVTAKPPTATVLQLHAGS